MVFAPETAPAKRDAFLDWYDQQTAWDEGDACDNLAVCAPALQAFHAELAAEFPPVQAEAEPSEQEAGTEYSVGQSLIYMSFHDWDKFDVSSDLAEVWLPDRKGGLRIAHSD
jgi:hypothetical protein